MLRSPGPPVLHGSRNLKPRKPRPDFCREPAGDQDVPVPNVPRTQDLVPSPRDSESRNQADPPAATSFDQVGLSPADFDALTRKSRGIFLPLWVVKSVENLSDAVLLAQVLYWFGKSTNPLSKGLRAKVRDKIGLPWLAKSHEDLAGETGLNPRTVRSSIQRLEAKGFIAVRYAKFGGLRVSHFRPRKDRLVACRTAAESRMVEGDPRFPGE